MRENLSELQSRSEQIGNSSTCGSAHALSRPEIKANVWHPKLMKLEEQFKRIQCNRDARRVTRLHTGIKKRVVLIWKIDLPCIISHAKSGGSVLARINEELIVLVDEV